MDRSRRMPQRRRHLGASASPTSASEGSFDLNLASSPVLAHTNTTPQSAGPGAGGRRSTKPLQHAFTFSPPGSSRSSNSKRRSTTMDNYPVPDEGEHGPKKGGHSLRKRARVDYTFEHIDDDVVVPNSTLTSSARGRKRRSEVNFDTDDFYGTDSKRRGASMGADTPSNRRRNPSRKSSEMKAYHQAALQDDDNNVQDTIEVGAYYSEVDEPERREAAGSNHSSPQSKMSPKTELTKTEPTKNELPSLQVENSHQIKPPTTDTPASPGVKETLPPTQASHVVEPTSTSIEEPVSQSAEPQTAQLPKMEPQPEASNTQQTPPAVDSKDGVSTPDSDSNLDSSSGSNSDKNSDGDSDEDSVLNSEPAAATTTSTAGGGGAAAAATAAAIEPEQVSAQVPEPTAISILEPKAEAVSEAVPEEAVPDVISEKVSETVPEQAAPEQAVPALITANENNNNKLIHSTIVPAPELQPEHEPVNGIPHTPTAELDSQELPVSFTANIKEEATHHPTVEEAPESPGLLSSQCQDVTMDKMDKMDIDPVQEENSAQDVEMTDAAPLDADEPTPTPAVMSLPLPSKAPSKSPSPPPSPSPSKSPSPSPTREIEQSREAANNTITSPQIDNASEAPTPVEVNGSSTEAEENNGMKENDEHNEPAEVPATVNGPEIPDSPQVPLTQEEPAAISSPAEIRAHTPTLAAETIETPASSAPSEPKPSPQKPVAPRIPMESMPQPTPVGRWAYLTPYVDGEYVLYPEKKGRDEDGGAEDATSEGKDMDMEPMVDDQDDTVDGAALYAPTPALDTPTRGSPVPDSTDPTAFNSPAPGGEDGDDVDVDSQEPSERTRYFKYRKLRDPEEYVNLLENYEDLSTEDLYELLEAVNVTMVQWQDEWNDLGKVVDDYENSLRRRAADAKYEARTRNLHQHGVNYEEPDFAVKGYKSRDKDVVNETRYLQSQDRIMAATYGFEYDPHPSKIGKQNPETQQVGVMTRGRSLRNQPRQTAKATETDEVVGKRQRKPVQLFDPATQDVSRSSTPAPTRGSGRRRKNADDDAQTNLSVSFNNEPVSDSEAAGPKTRRKRGTRGKNAVPDITDHLAPAPAAEEPVAQEEPAKSTRRGRARPAVKYEEADPNEFVDDEPQEEE
ncbi:hypothetical protein F66182_211, partial [Fusarium sp. NRRL 66182]